MLLYYVHADILRHKPVGNMNVYSQLELATTIPGYSDKHRHIPCFSEQAGLLQAINS